MIASLRQERIYRGYRLMVQHINGIEEKLLDLNVTQLGVYFRNASVLLLISFFLTNLSTVMQG
jgi:hypothetical protein